MPKGNEGTREREKDRKIDELRRCIAAAQKALRFYADATPHDSKNRAVKALARIQEILRGKP